MADSPAERIRQALHEVRTPINALQGFAEVIQQQLFGPVPNAYRAHAAAIAMDSATLMAGVDEIERLARLESGAASLESGASDLVRCVADTLAQLGPVLAPREAGLDIAIEGGPLAVPVAAAELAGLIWRLLATLAGALGPGERVSGALRREGERAVFDTRLPAAIGAAPSASGPSPPRRAAVSAGMFGAQFSLRLAAAEARAAGGELAIAAGGLRLALPLLTTAAGDHSTAAELA